MEPVLPNSTAAVVQEHAAADFDNEKTIGSSLGSATRANTPTHDKHDDSERPADGQQVDVARAESEFDKLRRELSRTSSAHRSMTGEKDFEKEGHDHDQDFDLVEYLRGARGAEDENGFKHKELGVIWDNLTVTGAGGMKIFIRTFPDAVKEFILSPVFMILMRTKMFAPKPKNLLHDFNGYARPGEMVLVLGRPGSGCTTFLKTIANERGGFLSIDGDVTYGGLDAKTMEKRYRGEVVYNMEDDIHHATLTVAQTLKFALNTKTPAKRLPEETRREFKNRVSNMLLKMLGIAHTANTYVGSAFVRGVSGGERKRVSIAEMMTTRAAVCAWDNSSRGLDASTALDYAKALRIMTDLYKTTTFVSLYQAGEGIYEQFDKVLVIDEGRTVYFGPAQEARQYMVSLGFQDLPRQTTADYLTGCTDENERRIQEGKEQSTPQTPDALADAFRASSIYERMLKEREVFREEIKRENTRVEEFRQAILEDKRPGTFKKSPYTVSFYTQVKALTVRQFQIRMQDKLGLYVSFATSIIVALITGACYFKLPQTAAGAFTRGGAIFLAVLFNAFSAFNELPTQMLGRPIMWKQAGFAFYRPAALSISMTLADAPINLIQIFIFCVILYFMVGLYVSAGAFFSFYVIVLSGYFSLAAFFRLLGTMTASFDVAARLASVLITFMICYGGYLIPVFSMKRWLFWIYYINPLNYAFQAAMENEFKRLDLDCNGVYITPYNVGSVTKYPTSLGPNQVCTLAGSKPGQPFVSGSDYLSAAFQYDVSTQWRNFGIAVAFAVFFLLVQGWAVEKFKHGANAPAINVFAKENAERKKLNAELEKNKQAFRRGDAEQDLSGLIQTRKPFTWENLTYTVPVPGGKRQLLDHVFGYVKPGELTALMGASGAGKTTLLDVLADRKTIGVIGGDVLVAGRPKGRDFQRGTAYVEQLDVHEHTATVREALRFSAYLRQPAEVPKAEKDAYVEQILQLLELEDLADSMIGFPGFGLGVEARKRLTIGVELASKPQLLLFLDEPTSGLDGQSAYNIVRFLRKLAAAGQAIVCTVHQPNALLFESFDRLLLLQRGGQCVYFGDIGKDSHVLRDYLSRNGAECPPDANPAEFMLEAIGAGSRRRIGPKDWHDIWRDSPEFEQTKREIAKLKEEGLKIPETSDGQVAREYATPFFTQLRVVCARTYTAFWRSADYCWTRSFNHIAIGLVVGITFLQLGNGLQDMQSRVFAIFFVTVLPAIIISQIEPAFIAARGIFARESSSKMYSQIVFAICQLLAELPLNILCGFLFYLCFYFPVGFNLSASRAGFQFLTIELVELFAVTLGQAVAALSPTVFIAVSMNPFLLIIFSLFCGVTIPFASIPAAFRHWLYYLDPFTWLINALVSTELHDLQVRCLPNEFRVFDPPSGQTCQQWAGDFVSAAGGYILDPNATSQCQYCQYSVGDQFYAPLNMNYDDRWKCFGYLVAYTAFNAVVTIVASRYLKYAKR